MNVGLYQLWMHLPRGRLDICLYDGQVVQGVLVGDPAQTVMEHFNTLTDHCIADGFAYGLLMGLRLGRAGRFVPHGADDDAPVLIGPFANELVEGVTVATPARLARLLNGRRYTSDEILAALGDPA